MPITSVKALRTALEDAGLLVEPGGSHLRIKTADGRLVGAMPLLANAGKHNRALLNCRSHIARRLTQLQKENQTP